MDEKRTQAVTWEVGAELGGAWLRFYTAGANPITIPIEPQAAADMGEKLARAAYFAHYGRPNQTDSGYLLERAKNRATEQMRKVLVQRVSVMLNSLREDKAWSNQKLATELLDVIFSKVA